MMFAFETLENEGTYKRYAVYANQGENMCKEVVYVEQRKNNTVFVVFKSIVKRLKGSNVPVLIASQIK